MSDALMGVRGFRPFNVIGDYSRGAMQDEINVTLTAARITRVMDQTLLSRGVPVAHSRRPRSGIREHELGRLVCHQRGIIIEYNPPGKPTQNDLSSASTQSAATLSPILGVS